MSDNPYIGNTDSNVIKNDRDDERVQGVLELMQYSADHEDRIAKLENIQENVKLKRHFHAKLPSGGKPMMKSSLYSVMARKTRLNGMTPPRIELEDSSMEAQMAKFVLDEAFNEMGYVKMYKDIYRQYDTEGPAIVFFNPQDSTVRYDIIPYEDFYYDMDSNQLFKEWEGFSNNNMRWFGFRRVVKKSTFDSEYPEFANSVSPGSVFEELQDDDYDYDGTSTTTEDPDQEVELFYCFAPKDGSYEYMVIAGAGATIIDTEWPKAWRSIGGEKLLPLAIYNFSDTEKVGLMSASSVDFVKDAAEALKKNFNHYLGNIGRILNAPTYMFGTTDEGDMTELEKYYSMSDAGFTPYIQRRDKDIKVEQLIPQDVSSTYRSLKEEVLDDTSERVGFQMRKHDNNPSLKVGIFARQEQEEGAAIRIIDERNELEFERTCYIVYCMKYHMGTLKDFTTKIDQYEVGFNAKRLKEALKDYEPKFVVDTDMDFRLTFQENIQVQDQLAQTLIQYTQMNLQNDKTIDGIAQATHSKYVKLGLGKEISKELFVEALRAEPQPQLPQANNIPAVDGLTPTNPIPNAL